jgi:hypothetical protein
MWKSNFGAKTAFSAISSQKVSILEFMLLHNSCKYGHCGHFALPVKSLRPPGAEKHKFRHLVNPWMGVAHFWGFKHGVRSHIYFTAIQNHIKVNFMQDHRSILNERVDAKIVWVPNDTKIAFLAIFVSFFNPYFKGACPISNFKVC